MKTNNIGGSSKSVKHEQGGAWSSFGGNKPPVNHKAMLPKDMNKPFLLRLKNWLTA